MPRDVWVGVAGVGWRWSWCPALGGSLVGLSSPVQVGRDGVAAYGEAEHDGQLSHGSVLCPQSVDSGIA